MVAERLVIAQRLRLLQNPEAVGRAGDWDVLRVVADHLEEYPRVRAALVQLPGGVQKPRSVPYGGRDPVLVPDGEADCGESPVIVGAGRDVRHQGDVIAGLHLAKKCLDRGVNGRSLLTGPADSTAGRRRL